MRLPLHSTPGLTEVDTEIFELRYFGDCMACSFCHDSCCQYGADVNLPERDRILAHAEAIRPFVGVAPEEWFGDEVKEDPEYPGGRYVRTRVRDGACVFLNRKGRGCALHAWSLAQGRNYHPTKPLVCWLFPVIYDQSVLRASSDVKDGLVCAEQGPSLYASARGELAYHFGEPLVEELDRLAARQAADLTRAG